VSEVEAGGRTQPRAEHAVDVRVDADPEQVGLLRGFAASIAIRMDFDVDAIEDLRMAVDEACLMLVRAGAPGSSLHCSFHLGAEELRVHARVETAGDAPVALPSADTLSWHILTSLADSVTEDVTELPTGHQVSIDLVSRQKGATDQ
jgi:serine/threonine-protein kinase RsbW